MEITEELIEVAALAMINAVRTSRGWPAIDAIPDDFQDADKWRFEARAAITAVAPLIAAGEREAMQAALDEQKELVEIYRRHADDASQSLSQIVAGSPETAAMFMRLVQAEMDANKARVAAERRAEAAEAAIAEAVADEREAIDALAKAIHQDRQFPPATRHGACLVREAIRARGAAS